MITRSYDALESLGNTLNRLRVRADAGLSALTQIGHQAESLKPAWHVSRLENQRMFLSRRRALKSLDQQPGSFDVIAGTTLLAIIGVGATVDDRKASLRCIKQIADQTLRRYGETEWIVSLDQNLTVAPRSAIDSVHTWVTLDCLIAALKILQVRAENGQNLGTLDRMLELAKGTGMLRYCVISKKYEVIPVQDISRPCPGNEIP